MQIDTEIATLSIPQTVMIWVKTNMMDISGGVAVLILGFLLAGIISRTVSKALERSDRFDLLIGISYEDSMECAREELLAMARGDDRVLDDPDPVVFVSSLDESSVTMGLRVWCNMADYLAMSWDLTEQAKTRFDKAGISIPFPQREVTQRVVAA
ncbi:MAG: mechanosensitive ion channel [Erythrobacter sp.]|uniref:mechanosensitive ion channel domain-containing protein n=1 Tax=Erythrobacter sp. TaxID=1042 RepID=UPI00262FDB22|nr:mechanosensitive ion channel domain-containing protein [Erythrobacter sp.]MDJ0979434.1 mechanosensitive ion channel [Erythrobacter sp.]